MEPIKSTVILAPPDPDDLSMKIESPEALPRLFAPPELSSVICQVAASEKSKVVIAAALRPE
jgi:hypothetical protein